MRITLTIILSLVFFQSYSQLQKIKWISPIPQGYQFVEMVNGPSSNYYALGEGGYFYELDDSLNINQISEVDRTMGYFHVVNGQIIHVLSPDVLYLKYKRNSNLTTPETHLLSKDGGKSWNSSPHEFQYLESHGDTSFGITKTGFYSSFDGGRNWSLNWSSDSLGIFEMVGDTVIYTCALRELRMHYGGVDSLLLDFQSPFNSQVSNHFITYVWDINYTSTKFGVLTTSGGNILVVNHLEETIDTVKYPNSGATVHHFGNLNYYVFKGDEVVEYSDTLKTSVTRQIGFDLEYKSIVPSDSGALVRYKYSHNGDFARRYGFLDFSNWTLSDVPHYRYPGKIGSPHQKKNGDILTFTNDNIYVWDSSDDEISQFKTSTPTLQLGKYIDNAYGLLLNSGNGAAALSMDEGDTWSDIRTNQSPQGPIRIQSPSEFLSIRDYTSSLSYGPPHNIQLVYSLDQGQTWNRSHVLSVSYGISDAWVFGTDSALGIVGNNVVRYNLPDLSIQPEIRTGPNAELRTIDFLSDGSLIAVMESGLYTSEDNGKSWNLRTSKSIGKGFNDLQFSGNGMMFLWNRDSSELIYSQDTGYTMSTIRFLLHQMNFYPGQKGDLIFTGGNRLAVFEVANDISVKDWRAQDSDIVFYPNPADSRIQLEIPKHFKDGNLEIYNIEGQKQISSLIETWQMELDLSTLSSGLYIVVVTKAANRISKKLLIMR